MIKQLLKKITCIIILCCLIGGSNSYSQTVSPYSVSPEWYFGIGGKLKFPNGDFPSSTAPSVLNSPVNLFGWPLAGGSGASGEETTTSVCFPDKTVALFTTGQYVYTNSSIDKTTYIADLITDNTAFTSSTCGGLSFPNPAGPNLFYFVTGNDISGGLRVNRGINYYTFNGTIPTNVTKTSGPTLLISNAANSVENLVSATDGNGNYYIISRGVAYNPPVYKVWTVTPSGVSAPVNNTKTAYNSSNVVSQSSIKVNSCQTKLAFSANGWLVVYDFDRTTGTIGNQLRSYNHGTNGHGLEFSPDGNILYWSGLGTQVNWINISTAATGSIASTNSWYMQLGPDGKIYTSGSGSSSNFRSINDPNNPTTTTTTLLTLPGGATIYQGLTNESWLSPQKPILSSTPTATCNVFDINFTWLNYFNTNITINTTGATIDYGDGSAIENNPTFPLQHTFPTVGTFTVTYTYKDLFCNQTWEAKTIVSTSCPLPVKLVNFSGYRNITTNYINWYSADEDNVSNYILQYSIDTKSISNIDTLKSKGSNSSYNSKHLTNNSFYYRLKIVDNDGSITYSNWIYISANTNEDISIFPNPSEQQFNITSIDKFDFEVFTVDGKLIESVKNTSNYNFGYNYSSGIYIVNIILNNSTLTKKVIKNNFYK